MNIKGIDEKAQYEEKIRELEEEIEEMRVKILEYEIGGFKGENRESELEKHYKQKLEQKE